MRVESKCLMSNMGIWVRLRLRVVWDRSRKEDCRERRFKDKRMRKKAKQDEMKETPDTIWVSVKFYSLWSFRLRNSLICLEESRVSAGARLRATGSGGCGWHRDLKPFFSCRMKLVTNAVGDGHKLSVLLTLHKKKTAKLWAFSLT